MNTSATASIIFDGDPAAIESALSRVERKMGSTESAVNNVGRSLTNLVGGYLSLQGVLQIFEQARHGEQLQKIRAGFEAITGGAKNAAAALEQGRIATQNTVADATLMTSIMKGLKQELDFTVVAQALAFAESQASVGAGEFEAIYDQVTDALFRSQGGFEGAARSLGQFGVSGRNATEILASMNKVMTDTTNKAGEADQTMDSFDANLKNIRDHGAEMIKEFLAPTVQHLSQLILLANGGNAVADLANIMDQFSSNSRPTLAGILGGDKLSTDALSAKSALQELFNEVSGGTATVESYTTAYNDLLRILSTSTTLSEKERAALQATTQQMLDLIEVRKAAAALQIIPKKSDRTDPDRIAADAKAADDALRAQIQNERDILKLKIGLGQETYAKLDQLVAEHEIKYKEFLARDTEAYKAWLADKVLIYQQDKAEHEKVQSEKYNTTRRFIGYILEDDARSHEQRLIDAIKFINDSLAAEQFGSEQRRTLLAQRADLERQFTEFLKAQYAEQIQFLEQTFGTTAQQILDDFFSGSIKSFEDYLKQLLNLIAKYALQAALSKLFLTLVTGGLGGLFSSGGGGSVGGGFMGGGGILGGATPPTINPINFSGILNSLPQVNGQIPFGNSSQNINNTVNPTPVQVTVHLDKYGIYSITKEGEKQYNRSSGS